MQNLTQKKCVPCEGGTEPLSGDELNKYLAMVANWQLSADKKSIMRELKHKDFVSALGFVNQVGVLAEDEGHHPDIEIFGYNKVKIKLSTHAIGGLSINDFIMAAKINELVE